jgi:uncharacterized repeat protein (TIGR01451 family)
MRITNLLLTTALLAQLGSFTLNARAADSAIKVTSIAQVEVEVTDKQGKKSLKRVPVTKAVPGTEVIYTNTFVNTIDKSAENIVINNPIPEETEYKAGSAFGKDCEILFSIDGKKFGHAEELKIKDADGKERTALPKEYTHIRWKYKVPLAAGKSGEVGYRTVIK